ncbi:MAG TPA: beta-lactamase family protein [Bacteroidales bacterium]|jgi:CubicO group peptidase (beta-lactamase class C family)|nr:beta-lactamase family protein [Bacteroidales bacterium]
MKKSVFLFFIFFAFVSLQLQAQELDTLAAIDAVFASYHNQMPGVAAAVSIDGRVIFNKAYGLANLEYNVPNTPQTLFEAGSVSKQFVAAGMLLLAKEGKVALSDDVRMYVPELPNYDATITIDMLLSHTSGLKDWGALYSLTGWPRTTRVYTQELGWDIIFKQKSLNFPPGTQYSYSNSNYMMLVLILERVSGQSLAQFTEERFFKPLGMSHTRWRDNHLTVIPDRATAYRDNHTETEYLLNMPFENLHGPGGLLTTTADLLRWNQIHESLEIFGAEFAQNRITERTLHSGERVGYAAGHTIGRLQGHFEVAHSGSTGGYRAWLAWYPEEKLSVVLLSNYAQFSPAAIGRRIATLFLPEPQQQESAPLIQAEKRTRADKDAEDAQPQALPVLKEYEGTYYSADIDTRYRFSVKEGVLKVYRKAGDTFDLTYVSPDVFTSDKNGEYVFKRNAKGKVEGFTVSVTRALHVPFTIF